MNRKYITELLSSFEELYPVQNFTIGRVKVWPLLRIYTAFYLMNEMVNINLDNREKFHESKGRVFFDFFNFLSSKAFIPNRRTKVVFLSYLTNRRYKHGRYKYDIYVDPILDIINEKRYKIYEFGNSMDTSFRHVPHSKVGIFSIFTDVAKALCFHIHDSYIKHNDLGWLDDFTFWLQRKTGIVLEKRNFLEYFCSIMVLSKLIEPFLKYDRPKVLLVVCWYCKEGLAAIYAAKKMGVIAVDIQHGLQGDGHFAYSGWVKENLWDFFPDRFWVWGELDYKCLIKNNRLCSSSNVIIGGNPWINLWKEGLFKSHHRKRKDKQVNILVTIQDFTPFDLLFDSIKRSPVNWHWYIKLHPTNINMQRKIVYSYIEKLCNKTKVSVVGDSYVDLYLYDLFKITDVHLTAYSTSAMEAIAFNLPTVLIHENGLHAYEKFIKEGIMIFANTPDEILRAIEKSFLIRISHKNIFDKMSKALFGTLKDTHNAWAGLVN